MCFERTLLVDGSFLLNRRSPDRKLILLSPAGLCREPSDYRNWVCEISPISGSVQVDRYKDREFHHIECLLEVGNLDHPKFGDYYFDSILK